jgi:hypothetical protein
VGLAEQRQGTPRPALDMVASQVLTVYHVDRQRAALGDSAAQSDA